MKAELYKLRTHRVPVACAALLSIAALVPSIVLIWYTPSDRSSYTDTYTLTLQIVSFILAAVFGAWLLGMEYSQGTIKRLLTSQPRRSRALATKALVGAGAVVGTVFVVGVLAWVGARIVGSIHDVTVAWEPRVLLGIAMNALIVATVAFGISAIARSFGYAMLATLAFLAVLDSLLSLIPNVGKYSLGTVTDRIQDWVAGEGASFPELSTTSASIALAAWMVGFVGGAIVLFTTRDV